MQILQFFPTNKIFMLKLIYMKGQMVGTDEVLLWPSQSAMSMLISLSRPRNKVTVTEIETAELLWPAKLINQQAHLAKRKDYSKPLALIGFIASILLGIVVGPVQLILIAVMLDYNWVTATYYPRALNYVFFFASLNALIDFAALILAWNSRPKRTYQTIALVIGSLTILGIIWLAGCIVSWQPHELTLILMTVTLIFLMAILLLSKQYIRTSKNRTSTKLALTILMALSILVSSFSVVYLVESQANNNPARVEEMTVEMQNSRIQGVPNLLSDLTYLLCADKYQIVHLTENKSSGIFECNSNGDVYSVEDINQRNSNSIRGAATYLGTTRSSDVSLSFPTSRYLYRSMPNLLDSDELVLMYPAQTEVELLDNVTLQLLNYWQNHNSRALFVNIFYNTNLDSVASTKDFILIAALGTLTLIDQLPGGNTRHGPYEGEMLAYIYEPDDDLKALGELGADPKLYASSTRESLTTLRHLSIRLNPGETYDYDTLHTKLQESFVSPE